MNHTGAAAWRVLAGTRVARMLAASCPWYLLTEPVGDEAEVNVRVRADSSGYASVGV